MREHTGSTTERTQTAAPFEPRVALASLSGEADAEWARAVSDHVGAAFLGGIALDEPTREAARAMVERDRAEFLPADPLALIDREIAALDGEPIRPGFNVRASGPAPVAAAASVCADHGAIVEINAHCRQEEMCAAGAGETLLRDPDRLCEQVRAAASVDGPSPTVSVKVRAEISGVDLPAVAARAEEAGADLIHVDAMDSEDVISDVVAATDATVIANNEVRDRESVREYLDYGADAVSVGRASDDPEVLDRVREATEAYFEKREEANA
jgi:TIM-barrel protein